MAADLKLAALRTIPDLDGRLSVSEHLSRVADAYAKSVNSVDGIAILVPLVVQSAINFERIMTISTFEVTGRLELLESNDARMAEVNARISYHVDKMVEQGQGKGDEITKQAYVHMNMSSNADAVYNGFQSLFSSVIINAWTAFEVLAGDLWEVALNVHPHLLSELKGRKGRISEIRKGKSGQGTMTSFIGNQERNLPLSLVQQYSYNLTNSMGSILRGSQSFDSLDGIRSAYSVAFSIDGSEIDEVLSLLSADRLSMLRNLLAHQGGKYDKTYLDSTAKFTDCPRGLVGERVVLDGEMVAKAVKPVLKLGFDLIMAVDKWIAKHPNKIRDVSKA